MEFLCSNFDGLDLSKGPTSRDSRAQKIRTLVFFASSSVRTFSSQCSSSQIPFRQFSMPFSFNGPASYCRCLCPQLNFGPQNSLMVGPTRCLDGHQITSWSQEDQEMVIHLFEVVMMFCFHHLRKSQRMVDHKKDFRYLCA